VHISHVSGYHGN